MSNETIKKKWRSLIADFKVLIADFDLSENDYFLKFEKSIEKLYKCYSEEFPKKKINFNLVKEKLNFDLDFNKLKNEKCFTNDYLNKFNKFKSSLSEFYKKIKDVKVGIVNDNIFKKKWSSFYDLLEVVKMSFDLKKGLQPLLLKVIFKELYSLLDRTVLEFCFNQFNKTIEDSIANNNPYINLFFNEFIKQKINKYKIILIRNYNKNGNIIELDVEANSFFKKIKKHPIWLYINRTRNDIEHFLPTYYAIMDENKYFELVHYTTILIGLNFYLIYDMDSK